MNKQSYIVNGWLIDLTSGFITHQNTKEKKRLGEYQLKLINVLLEHAGEILSRDELTNLVWKRRVIGNNSLPNAIHTLRVALGDENKQQRIIQTIPKIGYLLDTSYCEIINITKKEEAGEQAALNSINDQEIAVQQSATTLNEGVSTGLADIANIAIANTGDKPEYTAITESVTPTQTGQVAVDHQQVLATKRPSWNIFSYWGLTIIALLILITAVAIYRLFPQNKGVNYTAIEQDQEAYSNIRLFQLVDSALSLQQEEKLNQRLKDTLYTINKQSKAKNMNINIYYYVSLRRLEFTFSVESQCENKQLGMTIYHWRQNSQLLNNLIYREMERKINEMVNC
ncbi:winged helix-turn-helix domain-containing protein [Yersinia similis]|uniref:Putative regulatory protein n=1 Tax=Yersinia similis TaxID=367190 RepID=A0A0T9RD62_9GAMM|nr:transcriptional regulator [Yersinia similis]CNC29454.1 putative regulatory protein [Yersinia similis]CNF54172.1 putative regulatory protein [Yersinia similis]CNG39517.1 putative regulatory protein [Yersinia similis]CNI56409.1 putative regulatory protein [Yersinia similis]